MKPRHLTEDSLWLFSIAQVTEPHRHSVDGLQLLHYVYYVAKDLNTPLSYMQAVSLLYEYYISMDPNHGIVFHTVFGCIFHQDVYHAILLTVFGCIFHQDVNHANLLTVFGCIFHQDVNHAILLTVFGCISHQDVNHANLLQTVSGCISHQDINHAILLTARIRLYIPPGREPRHLIDSLWLLFYQVYSIRT